MLAVDLGADNCFSVVYVHIGERREGGREGGGEGEGGREGGREGEREREKKKNGRGGEGREEVRVKG